MTRRDYAVLAKRYIFLCFGLALMALGIGFSVKAKLGTSPISSLPYVVSLFSPFTIGQATIAMHCVFIAMQIALLRRRFDPVQLAQLPIGIMFGYMIDAGLWALGWVDCSAYWQLWLLVLVGIVLVGTGVACAVASGAVPLAGEAQAWPAPSPREPCRSRARAWSSPSAECCTSASHARRYSSTRASWPRRCSYRSPSPEK